MSDITIQPPQPLAITIAQTDPALAQAVDGFAQTLSALTVQINQAVASIEQKANQSQIQSILTALDTANTDIAAIALSVEGKAAATHTQSIESISGLTAVLNDLQAQIAAAVAPDLDSDLQAIAELSTTSFGRSLLTLADISAAKALLQIPSIVDSPDDIGAQPSDSDLTAIANLTTTAFGRGLLALADQAAAQSYIGSASGGSTLPTISNLTYTANQSTENIAASYANLTDGNATTGGVTADAGMDWIRADLGSEKFIDTVEVAGGSITGFGGTATILNQAVIQVSYDNSQWMTITGAITTADNSGTLQIFSIARRGRYVRIFRGAGRVGLSALLIKGYS